MRFNPDDLPIFAKGLIVASIPAVMAIVFLTAVGVLLLQSQEQARKEAQAKEILFIVHRLGPLGTESLDLVSRYALIKDNNLQISYRQLLKKKNKELHKLEAILNEDQDMKVEGQIWLNTLHRVFLFVDSINDSVKDTNEQLGVLSFAGFKRQMQGLFPYESMVRRAFVDRLIERQKESQANITRYNDQLLKIMPTAFIINLLMGFLLAAYFSRVIDGRLAKLADNASRFASGQPLSPSQKGRDEIGRLDTMFHRMASEIEEAALHEKAIIDNAVDVIMTLTDKFEIATINDAVRNDWGYAAESLSGKNFLTIIHIEDQATVEQTLTSISEEKVERSFECRLLRQDKNAIHTSISANWLEDERRFYCVAHDITQRKLEEALLKESEQMIRLVLESMPLGLLITDNDGLIEITNLSTKHLLGYRDNELQNQNIGMLFTKRPTMGEDGRFRKILEDTANGDTIEIPIITKTGDEFPAELTTNSFILNDQRKILFILQDITLRQEVEQLKKEFLAMVSHDLRTPLTTILGSMQLLQTGPLGVLNNKGREHIAIAEAETDRLIALVNTLLDIEKFESGQMELHREMADITQLAKQAINALISQAEEREIELLQAVELVDDNATLTEEEKRSKIDELATIAIDQASLMQVLINLVSNALKFSPAGTKIVLTTLLRDDQVELRVKDQGRGVPDSMKEIIFERFKQVDLTDRTEKKGSGLGLSICKLIVESHNGRIGVESTVGEGSTFWVRIPRTEKTS
ncbi:MAG: PAS domain S-box protein [Candidatus Obscuribacterales bacterium]|nr:PAS domain S-box protein [Candidatus Obscuribacterales bacterium]